MALPAAMLSLLMLAASGCDKGPKLIEINGKVNLDGQPTEGIGLLFFDKASNMIVASAKSGPGGAFTVMTQDRPGIPEGSYKVTATYPDPKFVAKPTNFGAAPEDAPDLLNNRYNPARSDIVLDINASTTEPVIELKMK